MKFPAGVHQMSKMPKGNDIAGKVWQTAPVVLPDGNTTEGKYVKYASKDRYGGFVYFYVHDLGYRAFFDRFVIFTEVDETSVSISFDLQGSK
jgi:hypothetical protein